MILSVGKFPEFGFTAIVLISGMVTDAMNDTLAGSSGYCLMVSSGLPGGGPALSHLSRAVEGQVIMRKDVPGTPGRFGSTTAGFAGSNPALVIGNGSPAGGSVGSTGGGVTRPYALNAYR